MADENDWLQEVKRWVLTGSREPAPKQNGAPDDVLGYEAADPALQAPQWPDAPEADGPL